MTSLKLAALLFLAGVSHAHYNTNSTFKVDVHSHALPQIWRQALVDADYPVINGTIWSDGYQVPEWNITSHLAAMDVQGVSYATLSITSPGYSFLANDAQAAAALARKVNLELYNYTQEYPTRIGALCSLPLPHVPESVEEINVRSFAFLRPADTLKGSHIYESNADSKPQFCLNNLTFAGVGLLTNYNGSYLGIPAFNPVYEALLAHNATSFVHPSTPGCLNATLGYPSPVSEYPFDTVRAIEEFRLSGMRSAYPSLNIIWSHGGGVLPYIAYRIAVNLGRTFLDGAGGLDVTETYAQFQGYFFDTASATTAIQLTALKMFAGVAKIVVGTDCKLNAFRLCENDDWKGKLC